MHKIYYIYCAKRLDNCFLDINNAIQNANDLSRVNKHNLRDYDNQRELIRVIYGTDNIVNDVHKLYLKEFKIVPTFKIANATIHFDETSWI